MEISILTKIINLVNIVSALRAAWSGLILVPGFVRRHSPSPPTPCEYVQFYLWYNSKGIFVPDINQQHGDFDFESLIQIINLVNIVSALRAAWSGPILGPGFVRRPSLSPPTLCGVLQDTPRSLKTEASLKRGSPNPSEIKH